MTIDLSTIIAGVKFPNPVILGSATPSWDGEHMRRALDAGAGGVIPKTIGPPQTWAQHPRCGRLRLIRHNNTGRPFGQVNNELFTTMDKDAWIKNELAVARKGKGVIIASILAMPNPEDTTRLAAEVEATGNADMLELNVSCPMPAGTVGMHIGKDAGCTALQVAAVKRGSKLPLTIKMTPNVSDLITIGKAAVDAGADALSISNSIRSFAGVNIDNGKPYLPAFGGYTGPAVKPIIQRLIIEVLQSGLKVPIIAVGGVMSWRDMVEYIMIGCSAIQTVTAVMWGGYQAITDMVEGLKGYMDTKGYTSINDFKGITLPEVLTIEEFAKRPPKFAVVDEALCNACKTCLKVCSYDAVAVKDVATMDKNKCDGCGLCVEWCPTKAIALKEL